MKHIKSLLVCAMLPMIAHAQDPNSCCNGLAPPSPDAIDLPLVSKFPLDVSQVCPAGRGMRAISFSHQKDENFTYQESFGLQCATSRLVVTNDCAWGPLISNFPLKTQASAPPGSVLTGIRFIHKKDENLTYQQSFAIQTCKLQTKPPSLAADQGGGTSKWFLQSHTGCQLTFAGQSFGLIQMIDFQHPKDLNLTDQETVFVGCLKDIP
jgi:hypothetical protein